MALAPGGAAVRRPDPRRSRSAPVARRTFTRIGSVEVALPRPAPATLGVFWMAGYAGGLFLPFRDATNGDETYGAGRYLLDTAKSADLGAGATPGTLSSTSTSRSSRRARSTRAGRARSRHPRTASTSASRPASALGAHPLGRPPYHRGDGPPPAAALSDRVRTLPRTASSTPSLATVGADGAPHQAVIWYRLDDDGRILVNSRSRRRWPTSCSATRRASLAVIGSRRSVALGRAAARRRGGRSTTSRIAREDIVALAVRYDEDDAASVASFRTQAADLVPAADRRPCTTTSEE